jgi:sorbitol-specific phosphotransferase system component IIC
VLTAGTLLMWIGILDMLVALIVLVKPIRVVLLWAALWGFWTALLRPIVGEPIWDFVERSANWGAPLALLLTTPWPRTLREWFR